VTGCGCALLVILLVGGITFMVFGSTDPGEPIAQTAMVARVAFVILIARLAFTALLRVAFAPVRRGLVRARRA
jgi:hypothetical protein